MSDLKQERRNFLKVAGLATAGVFFNAGEKHPKNKKLNHQNSSKKPNIIYFMADQFRGDCLGCMGNKVIRTPNIDSIAENGVCFTNGYTAAPSCTPARSGLLTGLSPWHHGMLGYGRVGYKYKYELPRMVRRAGYYTYGIGKMHWFPQKTLHGFHGTLVDSSGRVESPGYISDYRNWFKLQAPGKDPDATGIDWNEHREAQYAHDESLHPTYWTGQKAVELINNYNLDKPLMLKVSFARPHSPYDPPKAFRKMYNIEDMPEPAVGDWAKEFAKYPMTKNAAFGDFGVQHAKKARRGYYANITFIDEQIGRVIQALKDRGIYKNSLLMFIADHGDMLGDHHHWRKTYAYEGSANIPFLMQWPQKYRTELNRGSDLDHPVELRDVLPTFLDLTRQKIPKDMDGQSLLKLVREKKPEWRKYIDMEHSTCYRKENYWCALTDGKIKYIYFFYNGNEQLFDLQKDPHEIHNLSNNQEYQQRLKLWRQRMVKHLSERGPKWVKNGKLQIRKESMLYGPNFPGHMKLEKEIVN